MKTEMSERQVRLNQIGKAIEEKRAYLETAWGKRNVVGYNDDTGWAMTRNDGEGHWATRSFMVCLEDIKTEEGQ